MCYCVKNVITYLSVTSSVCPYLCAVVYVTQNRFYKALVSMYFFPRHRLASGTNEKIQLSSMVAAFQAVRDLVTSEAA